MSSNPNVVAVVGPTASGKSGVAVRLAQMFDGEVISADSRQVYTGLDIGTEKVTEEEKQGIPHHLLDVAHPAEPFTAMQFKEHAEAAVDAIAERGRLPIIAGGTGFYVHVLLDNIHLPEVPPDPALRAELAGYSTEELLQQLRELDAQRAETVDTDNPRRLIRAIEVAKALGSVPTETRGEPKYEALRLGMWIDDEQLRDRINRRLAQALQRGLVEEAEALRTEYALSWERIDELGLEYRIAAEYLRGELTYAEMVEKMQNALWDYARRQRRWFKRDERIQWFHPSEMSTIRDTAANFLQE